MRMPRAKWSTSRDCWESLTDPIDLLSGRLAVWSATFPTSGMTAGGQVYALPTSEPRTAVTEYSFLPTPRSMDYAAKLSAPAARRHALTGRGSLPEVIGLALLPTPRTTDVRGAGQHGEGGLDLRTAVKLLPTPGVADVMGGHERRGGKRSGELLLKGVVKLLPTPDAHASNSGETPETWLARRARVKERLGNANGNGMGMSLAIAAQLIGEPTSRPSGIGSGSSAG